VASKENRGGTETTPRRSVVTVIVPDDKNWTWVLDRACPECGFDARVCTPQQVAPLVRDNADTWQRLARDGTIKPGRPNDATWSSLEYACHVRDVYRRYERRIDLMLSEDDPLYPNWDQDASAVDDGYEVQDPDTVVADLADAANLLARKLDPLTELQWQRPGRRSDGASFTVSTIARYMVHDTIHHVWDVSWSDRRS
jgi:hypothetical protein